MKKGVNFMKKLVTVVSVLCTGLLVVSPLKNVSYGAEVTNKTTPIVVDSRANGEDQNLNEIIKKKSYIDSTKVNLTSDTKNSAIKLSEALANAVKKENVADKNKNLDKDKVVANNKPENVVQEKDKDKNDVIDNNKVNEDKEKQGVVNNENKNDSKEDDKVKEDLSKEKPVEYLSKEQSLNLLKSHMPDVSFYYEGDENTFEFIKDKGLKGYVFLPQVDGDLAYFVDKASSSVYFFHPSGYLELIR